MSVNQSGVVVSDRDSDSPEFRITPFQQALSSCTGAVLTSLVVTPLDVVKIRLQAQQHTLSKCFLYCNGLMDHICNCGPGEQPKWLEKPGHIAGQFNGTIDAFVKISRTEGVTSLWSGLSPTLVLAVPSTVLYFVSYEQIRIRLKDYYNKRRIEKNKEKIAQPYWIPIVAGSTARFLSVIAVNPLELIRTKMQSQKLTYKETMNAVSNLLETNGLRGLWKGIAPTLVRDVPFSAIYWVSYESYKKRFMPETPNFAGTFIGGAISGTIAALITLPSDVVKTNQQIDFGKNVLYTDKPKKTKSSLTVLKEIYASRGFPGLFAGVVPRIFKVAPACAIMISSFEYGKVKKQNSLRIASYTGNVSKVY